METELSLVTTLLFVWNRGPLVVVMSISYCASLAHFTESVSSRSKPVFLSAYFVHTFELCWFYILAPIPLPWSETLILVGLPLWFYSIVLSWNFLGKQKTMQQHPNYSHCVKANLQVLQNKQGKKREVKKKPVCTVCRAWSRRAVLDINKCLNPTASFGKL